jgi:hypothetical protein
MVYSRPVVKIPLTVPARLPTYEIAAIFVARGHGLIEVVMPSQRAIQKSIKNESIIITSGL